MTIEQTDYGQATAPSVSVPISADLSPYTTTPSDTYFTFQWHLYNTGQTGGLAGIDLNVLPVWEDYKGQGVNIAVIDDGFDLDHADLAANFDLVDDWDARDTDDDPSYADGDDHGTAVAGVIAADDNGTGVVGVAPDATLTGIRIGYGEDFQIWDLDDAMGRMKDFDVVNNSWGFTGAFSDDRANPFFAETFPAITDAATNGRDGLGTVILFAAGNYRAEGDNANYHNLLNDTQTIAVGAIRSDGTYSGFSSKGANILVSAPGEAILTTDAEGDDGYLPGDVVNISGTSFSTPAVAGVVALMLEANSRLGYRDIQEILANAARQIDADYADWQVNGAGHWNGGGMQFSHQYGYGLVDAHAAVRLAESWAYQSTAATLDKVNSTSATLSVDLGPSTASQMTITNDMRVEQIEIHLDFSGTFTSEGQSVVLIAPDGTESVLIDQIGLTAAGDAGGRILPEDLSFTFSTVAHWGSQIAGNWQLEYRNASQEDSGTITWSMTFHGETSHSDDTYIYTDAYGELALVDGRDVLTDFDGGTDILNLSAVTSASLVDLSGGVQGQIAGQNFQIGATTQIETLIGGDGDDIFTGNALDNVIFGGRGNDTINSSDGDNILYGNDGNDLYANALAYADLTSATIAEDDAIVIETAGGTDTLYEFETYQFGNEILTHDELVQRITTPADPGQMDATVRWSDGGMYQFIANQSVVQSLTYEDLGIQGGSGVVLTHGTTNDVTAISGDASVFTNIEINHSLPENLDIQGFGFVNLTLGDGGASNLTISDFNVTALATGDGDDQVILAPIDQGDAYAFSTVDLGQGDNRLTINSGALATGSIMQVTTGNGADVIVATGAVEMNLNSGGGADDVTATDADDRLNTGSGNDIVRGQGGRDIINAGGGDDTAYGGSGNDDIYGEGDDDTLYGEEGQDLINAGSGHDTAHGGIGNDFLFGEDGNDVLNGDEGDDFLYGGDHDDTLNGGDGQDQILGDAGNDTISGGLERDTIFGGAGIDEIHGNEGNDLIYGDDGDDIIDGDDGDDILYGNAGSDTLRGGDGADFVSAREGGNILSGGAGNDTIFGAEGQDIIDGDDDDDLISGGLEADLIRGGDGEDTLYGAAGDDEIHGGNDHDRINGDDGNDLISGGDGGDILSGDNNNDTLNGNEGNDWVYGGNGNDDLYGDEGNDYLYGQNDIDLLMGGIGVDSLDGGAGDDILIGGADVDYLTGGAGSDIFRASADENAVDAILDWGTDGDADTMDLSLLLGEYQSGQDDLNDFVQIISNGGIAGSTVQVSTDGSGANWESVFDIYGTNLSSVNLNALLSNGSLIVE